MVRTSLLLVALLAVAGCTMLQPPWLSTTTPAAGTMHDAWSASSRAATQPPATDQDLVTQPPPGPAKPDDRATADYLRELAKGVDLEQSRRYAEANTHYEQLTRQSPARYEAYQRLGQVCDRQKRFAEAQENYQRAILLAGSGQPDLFNDLGYSFFLQGKLDKAASAMRKAVALRPTEPKYHNNLGLIYGHQRRMEDAWNEFRQAGGEAEAFYNLAFIKSALNDVEGAKACFHKALAVDPSHERARRALRAFEMAETDPDSLAQLETADDDGTQWVPYVENGQNQDPNSPTSTPKDAGGKGGGSGSLSTPTLASRNTRNGG